MTIPVLETERLILRGHRPDDFPAYAQMWADPAVTRFIGGAPLSEEDAWAKYSRLFGQWQLLGFGFWCLTDKRHRSLAEGHPGMRLGARTGGAAQRLCDRSSARCIGVGRCAFRQGAHGLHHRAGEFAIIARRGKDWVS